MGGTRTGMPPAGRSPLIWPLVCAYQHIIKQNLSPMKIKIYTVVEISTDDCSYCARDYHDTFSSQAKADAYIASRCEGYGIWAPPEFEVVVTVLEAEEFVD